MCRFVAALNQGKRRCQLIQMNYVVNLCEELIAIPSPGGDCRAAMRRAEDELTALGYAFYRTNKDAVIATLEGQVPEGRIVVSHMDTLGAVVSRILPNGRLRVLPIGGYSMNAYEGENLLVHTESGHRVRGCLMPDKASRHAWGEECTTMERNEHTMAIRLDEKAENPDDVKALGIDVGDLVSFDPRFERSASGYLKSRYLDDKACVAAMFGAMKALKEQNLKPYYTTHFYISNYEEVGHGLSVIPEGTTECVAIDIGIVAETTNSVESAVAILARDSRTPYDVAFRHRLMKLARQNGVDYRVDTPARYGSDASVGALAGFDYTFACFGPGVDATHHYERTHEKAIEGTAQLVLAYVMEEAHPCR